MAGRFAGSDACFLTALTGFESWVGEIQIFWPAEAVDDSLGRVSDVTRVIEAIQRGDPKAAEELLPLVYGELRRLAASRMANEAAGNTLQPTALVHEAWL